MAKQITISIGSCGLNHEDWVDTFYPEDMPRDWRFEFYAHEFRTLLLPACEFPDAATWLEWHNALDDRFQLFIELPAEPDAEMLSILDKEPGVLCLKNDDSASAELAVIRDTTESPGELNSQRVIYISEQSAGQTIDLKSWKQRLYELADSLPEGAALYIIMTGTPPSIEAMRQLTTLVELLGWS
jgi:hypothetical protein